ncbi:MAG: glycosyltransferase family 4 protein [Labilibaculum sp.]|nr:glycosyltransferase family 4 protein [Labilibaculum sp.]
MKLLYITNGINGAGGLERVLSIKASYLAEHYGYEVTIVTLNEEHPNSFYTFSSKVRLKSITVNRNPLAYILSYIKGIQKIIKEEIPDVISVCDDGLKGLLFPILFGEKIPVIYERHAAMHLNFISNGEDSIIQRIKNYYMKNLMVWGAKKFASFVVLTRGNINDWPGVKCSVIPNSNPYSHAIENEIKPKSKLVLAVGSQSYNKGYDRLFLSWKMVTAKHPEWKLKIYGKENLALNLQDEIDKLRLQHTVYLEKPVNAIGKQYEKAAIYVMPSRSEGFGMVLIEAMSFGVPCISFDCPYGPADIIKNGEDGFLIENGNSIGFAETVIELIENEEMRKGMGSKAKKNVKRYAPDKIVPIWDELFKSLLV